MGFDTTTNTRCSFHHVQVYAKELQSLAYYKTLEKKLNDLANSGRFDPFSGGMRFLEPSALPERIQQGRSMWKKLIEDEKCGLLSDIEPETYAPHQQDLVEQLIVGLGWRVTAEHVGTSTRSLLVTSMDACGVKLVVSTCQEKSVERSLQEEEGEYYDHFDSRNIVRFYEAHQGREGVAVLGFELGNEQKGVDFGSEITRVFDQYKKLHPKLLVNDKILQYSDVRTKQKQRSGENGVTITQHLGTMKVFEVYAYYRDDEEGEVDKGTIIRFVERQGTYASQEGFGNPQGVLPGLVTVEHSFDGTSIPAYSDHWVSNVHNRTSFLKTLNDVLGFTPKVDFNAGVVAAGRAKIESTVTGNDAPLFSEVVDNGIRLPSSMDSSFLRNQTQVYLPINNALSEVGHVHGFLKEIGQGVQHLANRVENLVAFIERANNYRKITGRGFSFLKIPRSYYGHLDINRDLVSSLSPGMCESKDKAETERTAAKIFNSLVQNNLVTVTGIVDLDASSESISKCVSEFVADSVLVDKTTEAVLRARYFNMYSLLRENLDERSYIQIVRNQVLVDIQGHDILYQIFTSNILQAAPGEEAPFLEFIQRVCSQQTDSDGKRVPIKPGCGGFGIRNFLTLFLSIEVSKAMNELEDALSKANAAQADYAKAKVDLFTRQLNESNPVLTDISDAMTKEAEVLEEIEKLKVSSTNSQKIQSLELVAKEMNNKKLQGNMRLQQISSQFSAKFMSLEEDYRTLIR
mmetsp:Transcript_10077/g.11563  ORF Transcript_10077/g.11563 Transcript_10077/m.11563 type:complete len:744 (-) Transcript_10077:556-2787(-)